MMPDKHPSSIQPMPAPTHDFARRTLDALDVALGALLIGLGIEVLLAAHGRPFLVIVGMGLTVAGGLTVGRVLGRAALHAAEVVAQADLNRDGVVGDPDRIILVNGRKAQTTLADFVVAAATDPTERRLMALGFTDEQIGRYRDALVSGGWAAWASSDRRHGWRLTADAGAILRSLPRDGEDA
jgi:hypothetical protein